MNVTFLKKWRTVMTVGLGLACCPFSVFAISNLHPHFTIKHILPPELSNVGGIGGIGLLPNGDGVICTWGGSQRPAGAPGMTNGEAWIIPALASGNPGTPVRVATGLREALGVAVVGPDFYVMEKPRISKFTGSGATWTKTTLWSLPTEWYTDSQWHHFSFNLVIRDNAFWFTTGTAYDYDPKDPIQRGALIKVPMTGGGFTQLARGLRNTNGLGIGPDNEFFVPENQGHWKPFDALYHIPTANVPANGRFFGFRTEANNACGTAVPAQNFTSCPNDPEYPPAVYLPHGSFANSPTRPILLKEGPYAGQMIGGDVNHGGTIRYFLEKVGGEWQGAAFGMMTAGPAGINFGINQFLYTPTGSLLVAGIGGGTCGLGGSGNWNWNSTCRGLDLLTPTDKAPFEMLAVKSQPDGFDVEFTQPAGAAASNKANWVVKTTVFSPVQTYGLDPNTTDNNVPVGVTNATLSADGTKVHLELASMSVRRMYTITMNNVASATGEAAYTNVAYYTLNKTGVATAIGRVGAFQKSIRATAHQGRISLEIPFQGRYQVAVFSVDGTKVAELSGFSGKAPEVLATGRLHPGIYLVAGKAEGSTFREKIRVE